MRGNRFKLAWLIACVAAGMSGCSTLPRSGPAHGDVDKGAAVKVTSKDGSVGIDYVLVDVNKSILPYLTSYQDSSLRRVSAAAGDPHPAFRSEAGMLFRSRSSKPAAAASSFRPTQAAGPATS